MSVQHPIGSGFTAASTAAEVIRGIDLSGKTAIVTGGYSGLGRETVRAFADQGAHVIVPARDVDRATANLADIAGVAVWPMDLLDPTSIDAFADRFLATGQSLHILVNSAGIMALPTLQRDSRGHELQFATNHLGHFQLTLRLWPALVKAHGARVISVASLGHRFSPVVFEDVDFRDREYTPFTAYGQSKTANVLFAVELDRRGQQDGVRAFAVHPGGIVDTGLAKHLEPGTLEAMGAVGEDGQPVIDPAKGLKTPEQGASTQVWAATSTQLDGLGGVYCENVEVSPIKDADLLRMDSLPGDTLAEVGVYPHAIDPAAATTLWALSEKLTSVRLPAGASA